MKRAKVHEVSSPISLFPFIGILLCTMGALLVILVAVSRSAKESAQVEVEAAREAGAHANQEDAAQLEQVSKYAANLHVVRTNGQNKLREEQARLSHLEDHIRRLREKIRSLQAAAVELKALEQEHYDDRGQAERELAKLQRLAAELQQSNASLRDEVAKGKRSYALVPYEGPNGTFRRPIYVECLEHELVLQPEGVVITADDLRPPFGAGNALASALRAARDYLIRIHPGEGASRDTEPYPLLLVRPEGLHSYDRARRAIEAGDFDFGFELIESDWDLKYPAADYKLAELESTAIEQARVRQQVLAEAAPRAYRNPSLAAAGQFEYDDEQLASAPNGRNMYVVRRKEPRGGTGLGGRGTEEGRYGGGFSGEGAGEGSGGGASGEGSGGGASGDGGADNGTADGAPGSGETGSGGAGAGGYGVEGSAGGGGHGHGAGGGVSAGVAGGGYPGGPASSGSGVPGNASQASNSGSGTYTAAAGGAAQSIGSSAGSINSAFGSEPPDNDRSAAPRRTDFADAQQAQPGMYQDPGPSRHTPAQKPDEHDPHSKSDQDLSASRGQDWALRNKPGRAVPVRRTIRVVVRHNQLAILTDDPQQPSVPPAGKTIPLPGDTVQSLDAFVAEVRKLIDDWGIAGENLYWRPVLVLSVAPDGQQRAADLARLLKNSGLELSTGEVANHTSQGNPR